MRPEVTFNRTHRSRRSILAHGTSLAAAALVAMTMPALATNDTPAAEIGILKPGAAHKAALAGEIFLIDIRRPEEWRETRVGEGAIGLDMREEDFVSTLVALRRANPDKPIALICRTGARTNYVTNALAAQGFPGLVDVNEGMVGGTNGPGWLSRGLPTYEGSPGNISTRRTSVLP